MESCDTQEKEVVFFQPHATHRTIAESIYNSISLLLSNLFFFGNMRSSSVPSVVQQDNNNVNNNDEVVDNSLELLMRHSSPLNFSGTIRPVTSTTTITIDGTVGNRSNVLFASPSSVGHNVGNSSNNNNNTNTVSNTSNPSPLRLNRPRSNPRNRTPNRASIEEQEEKEQEEVMERRVLQRQQVVNNLHTDIDQPIIMEGRRITIRPMAGAAVGTNMAGTRVSF
jgi:hypothetical protein